MFDLAYEVKKMQDENYFLRNRVFELEQMMRFINRAELDKLIEQKEEAIALADTIIDLLDENRIRAEERKKAVIKYRLKNYLLRKMPSANPLSEQEQNEKLKKRYAIAKLI